MAQLKVEYIEAYEKYSNGKTMHTPHLAARFYFNRKAYYAVPDNQGIYEIEQEGATIIGQDEFDRKYSLTRIK